MFTDASGTPGITQCRATERVRRSQCSSRRSRRQCARRSSWQRVRNSAYLSFGRARSVAQPQSYYHDGSDPSSPRICVSPRFIPFTSRPPLLFFSSLIFASPFSFSLSPYLFSHLRLLVRSSTSLFSFNNVLFSRVRPHRRYRSILTLDRQHPFWLLRRKAGRHIIYRLCVTASVK